MPATFRPPPQPTQQRILVSVERQTLSQSLASSVSATVAIARVTAKAPSASLTATVAVAKMTARTLSASCGAAAACTKRVQRALSASLSALGVPARQIASLLTADRLVKRILQNAVYRM